MHSSSDSEEEGSRVTKIPTPEWVSSGGSPLFKSENYFQNTFNYKLLAH